jgi:hypothetical protein
MPIKSKALFLCLPLLTMLTTGCPSSKLVVTKVEPATAGTKGPKISGVFYALPRTVIKIDVPLVRKDYAPGKYAKYAKFFFPDDEFNADTDHSSFTMNSAKFTTVGEPDPAQIYQVKIPAGGYFITKSLKMELTEAGIPTKIESAVQDDTLDIAIAGLKSVASVAAPFFLAPAPPPPPRTIPPPDEAAFLAPLPNGERSFYLGLHSEDEKNFYRILGQAERAFFQQLNQDERDFYRKLTISEANIFRSLPPAGRDYYRTLTPEERGPFAADPIDFPSAKKIQTKIQQLIDARDKIISGGTVGAAAPLSGEALTIMLKNLDDRISNLKDTYFLGTVTSTESTIGTFSYRPDAAPSQIVLFRFSSTRGVSEVLVDQGVKTPKKFFREKVCTQAGADVGNNCDDSQLTALAVSDAVPVFLALVKGRDGLPGPEFSSRIGDANFNTDGDHGFYYRVPAAGLVRLYEGLGDQKHERGRDNLLIAQLGIIASIPASFGGRKSNYTLELYEGSGALKNFLLGSDAAIQKSNIDDIGTAAKTLSDSEDKVKKLQREKDILQLQKDINDLRNPPPKSP